MTVTIPTTDSRNATLADLANLLQTQSTRKIDVVCPASAMSSRNGVIRVKGAEHQLSEDGVTVVDGNYKATEVFDQGMADRLGIPVKYLRRMRTERPDLLDTNINSWLHGKVVIRNGDREVLHAPDARSFLFRGFRGEDETPGVARALLSDRYYINDNLDVLTTVLSGVRESGVEVEVDRCDLTDRRMYMRIKAPAVAALAPDLLKGYRSPFSGASGDENPTVFAGFIVSNSETGCGAFSLTPQLIVQICSNGMTMCKDVMRSVHLGSKMDEGVIRWSADTDSKNLALIQAKARDAVAAFLDVEYIRRNIAELERVAGKEIADPAATIKHVAKKLLFTEDETAGILSHFIRGSVTTAGGLLHAVTSYAQTIDDADAAHDLENKGVEAMHLAAA